MPQINMKPHAFAIRDEDLLFGGRPSNQPVRDLRCYVCGDKPGEGMHAPPAPPTHKVIVGEVAKTLAGALDRNHDSLCTEAARAAFTTIQQVRKLLEDLGKNADAYDHFTISNIDTQLDNLLTELRREGWTR
jgi:hypothetical protein